MLSSLFFGHILILFFAAVKNKNKIAPATSESVEAGGDGSAKAEGKNQ